MSNADAVSDADILSALGPSKADQDPVSDEKILSTLGMSPNPAADAFEQVSDGNPDRIGRVMTIADKTGEHPAYIDNNLEQMEREANAPTRIWFDALKTVAPKAFLQLASPGLMALTLDDLDNLPNIEKMSREFVDGLSGMKRGVEIGSVSTALAFLRAHQIMQLPPELTEAMHPGLLKTVLGTPIDQESMIKTLEEEQESLSKQQTQFDLAHPVRSISTGLATAAPMLAGAVVASIGGVPGEAAYWGTFSAGSTYGELKKIKTADGKPIPDEWARLWAIASGVVSGGIAAKAVFPLLKAFASRTSLGRQFIEKLTSEVPDVIAKSATPQGAIWNSLKDFMKGQGATAATIAAFDAATQAAIGGAKITAGEPLEQIHPLQAALESVGAGVRGMFEFTPLVAYGAGMGGIRGYKGYEAKVKEQVADLTRNASESIHKAAEVSKLASRNRPRFEAAVKEVLAGTPMDTARIPLPMAQAYLYQSGKVDGDAFLREMGAEKAYRDATKKGELEIPTHKLIGTRYFQDLMGDVKYDQEGITPNEAKAEAKVREEKRAKFKAEAGEVRGKVEIAAKDIEARIAAGDTGLAEYRTSLASKIKSDMAAAYKPEGVEETARQEHIDKASQIAASYYINEGARQKVDPEQLYRSQIRSIVPVSEDMLESQIISETEGGSGYAALTQHGIGPTGEPLPVPIHPNLGTSTPKPESLGALEKKLGLSALPDSIRRYPRFVKTYIEAALAFESAAKDLNLPLTEDSYKAIFDYTHEEPKRAGEALKKELGSIKDAVSDPRFAKLSQLAKDHSALYRLSQVAISPQEAATVLEAWFPRFLEQHARQDSFEKMLKKLPSIANYDPSIHKTPMDLAWIAQHEVDMWSEGQDDAGTKGQAKACAKFIDYIWQQTGNEEIRKMADGALLEVGLPQTQRMQFGQEGRLGFYDAERKVIGLVVEKANPSTLLHEPAHAWIESMFQFVKSGEADESYIKHFDAAKKFLNIKEDQSVLTREQHEKFAESLEDHFMQNKDVPPGMEGIFAKFRQWLTQIYRKMRGQEIPEEMRAFFNRMIAGEDEVAKAVEETGYKPSEIAGMPGAKPEAQRKIRSLQERARDEAESLLIREQLKDIKANWKEFLEKRREDANLEATKEVMSLPIQKAKSSLKEYKGMKGKEDKLRIAAQSIIEGKMPEEKVLDFDIVAEMYGFSSGSEVAQRIIESKTFDEEVQSRVDTRMAEWVDMKDRDVMREYARELVHSEKGTELLALERQTLEDMMRSKESAAMGAMERKVTAQEEARAAREEAHAMLSEQGIKRATDPRTYITAERMAAVRVSKDIANNDIAAAVEAKRQQMFNHAAVIEAFRNKKIVDNATRQIAKITKKPMESFKDSASFAQVSKILERYGFGPHPEYMPSDKDVPLASWSQMMDEAFGGVTQDEAGNKMVVPGSGVVDIADWIMLEGEPKEWKDMTVSEISDVKDALKNIIHIANMRNNTYRINKGEEIVNIVQNLIAEGSKNMAALPPKQMEPGKLDRAAAVMRGYMSSILRIDTLTNKLDGWKDFGLFRKIFLDSQRESADVESRMTHKALAGMKDLYALYEKSELRDIFSKKVYCPEVGATMTKQRMLAMGLQLGNEVNREKLMNTRPVGISESVPWGEDTVIPFLEKRLTGKDWQFIQGVWNLINTLWPEASKLHEEMTGFAPQKVEAMPFSVRTAEGVKIELEGGYYPLREDHRATERAAVRELSSGPLYTDLNPAFKATTKTGHLKKRTQAQYSVGLELSTINDHLRDVIHDIAFRGTVYDLRRIITHPDMVNWLKGTINDEGYRSMKQYVDSIATGGNVEKTATDSLSNIVREMNTRVTKSIIVARVSVILQNLSNPFLAVGAVEDFGPVDVAKGMFGRGLFDYWPKAALYWRKASEIRESIWDKSSFMRDRRENPEFTLMDLKGTEVGKDRSISEFFLSMLGGSDDLTNIPLWQEAFEKKLKSGADEKEAIKYADTLIDRITGSGRKYDIAKIMRGSEIEKALSKLYSFWNVEYQNWVRNVGKEIKDPVKNTPAFLGFVASRAMFVYASAVLSGRFPKEDDTDEEKSKWWMKEFLSYPISFFPGVREIGNIALSESLGVKSFGYRPAPLVGAVENMNTFIKESKKAFAGDVEPQKAAEAATKMASVGIPYITPAYPDQFNSWFWNAYDYWENGMEPKAQDIYRRRPVSER